MCPLADGFVIWNAIESTIKRAKGFVIIRTHFRFGKGQQRCSEDLLSFYRKKN